MQRQRVATVAVVVVLLGAVAFVALRARDAGRDAPAAGGGPRAAPAAAGPAAPITLAVGTCPDGRLLSEPCSRVPGGGLLSLKPFFDIAEEVAAPSVPVLLGDVLDVPGELGRRMAAYVWNQPVALSAPQIVAAGPADLAYGSEFLRTDLGRVPFQVLCANALDAQGAPVLRSYALALDPKSNRVVLFVASVEPAAEARLVIAGSDVRLSPAAPAVRGALAEAEAHAKRVEKTVAARVLLHHGTVDETAALLGEVPGFTLAVAARGGVLPAQAPHVAGGVPVFEGGRGLRFGWYATVEDGKVAHWSLVRLGIEHLNRGSPAATAILDHGVLVRDFEFPEVVGATDGRPPDPRGAYAGAARCATCHPEQAADHAGSAHAKLPARFQSDALGRAQCLDCHVTGAFAATGWRGRGDAGDLAAVSCEACHGPGAAHAEGGAVPYGEPALAGCRRCHTPERSPQFDAEALWKRFGHGAKR